MDKPTHLIEFEMMLIGRHLNFFGPRRRDAGRLDRSAYTMLSRLSAQGPMSIGQLSDAFGLDSSTVNRQTSALLKGGLAERIAGKFQITEDGARRLDHERARAIESLERVLAEWDAEDVVQFARYLERFNIDIERMSGSPWSRRADIGQSEAP